MLFRANLLVGSACGLCMIDADSAINNSYIDSAKWSVNIAGTIYSAKVSLKTMYDPSNRKIKM